MATIRKKPVAAQAKTPPPDVPQLPDPMLEQGLAGTFLGDQALLTSAEWRRILGLTLVAAYQRKVLLPFFCGLIADVSRTHEVLSEIDALYSVEYHVLSKGGKVKLKDGTKIRSPKITAATAEFSQLRKDLGAKCQQMAECRPPGVMLS